MQEIDIICKADIECEKKLGILDQDIEYYARFSFFLGPTRIEHSDEKYSVLNLLSDFGGLFSSVFSLIGILGCSYDGSMLFGHLISKLYFTQSSCHGESRKHLKTVEFGRMDVFHSLKLSFYKLRNIICKCKNEKIKL